MGIVLSGLMGIIMNHNRDNYWPTSIMGWDSGIFHGSVLFENSMSEDGKPNKIMGCLVAHPTARKWVITPVINGIFVGLIHINHWGYSPLTKFVGSSPPSVQTTHQTPTLRGNEWFRFRPLWPSKITKQRSYDPGISRIWLCIIASQKVWLPGSSLP